MINNSKIFETVAKQIHEILPKKIKNLGKDIEKKIFCILKKNIKNFNLVNREEFEIQKKILLKNREKLIFLEKKIISLEKNITFDKK